MALGGAKMWMHIGWHLNKPLDAFLPYFPKTKFMKIQLITFIFSLFIFSTAYSAEYNGWNIDGVEFDCAAYSYDTGNWYYVTVEFYADEAIIYFNNGGYITVTIDDELIDDPMAIDAYDYERSIYWQLEVDELN